MIPNTGSLALAFFQDTAVASEHDLHVMMWLLAVVAACLLVLACAILVAGIVGLKLYFKVNEIIDTAKKQATPLVAKTHEIINDLTPKIKSITANVEQISNTVRAKADEIADTVTQVNKTVQDTNIKTHTQIDRVNGIVTDALTATSNFSQSVQHGIRVPLTKLVGVVQGLRIGMDTLVERSPLLNRKSVTRDPYEM